MYALLLQEPTAKKVAMGSRLELSVQNNVTVEKIGRDSASLKYFEHLLQSPAPIVGSAMQL